MKPLVIGTHGAVLKAVGIAFLVACVIGFNLGDSPAESFSLLFLYTFAAAIAWRVLFAEPTLDVLERGFRRPALGQTMRFGLTVAALVCIAIWYGPVVMTAGYFRLFGPLVVSAIVCLLAPRFPVGFGIVTVICIAISCAIESSRTDSPGHAVHWSSVLSDPEPVIFGSCVLFGMSLLVSIPIHFYRKAQALTPVA